MKSSIKYKQTHQLFTPILVLLNEMFKKKIICLKGLYASIKHFWPGNRILAAPNVVKCVCSPG